MPIWAQILIVIGGIGIILGLLPFVLKGLMKTRLLPLAIYLFAIWVSTFFTDWTLQNKRLVLTGLYILIGVIVLSWIWSLVKKIRVKRQERFLESDAEWQIRRALDIGVLSPNDTVQFDKQGNLLNPKTGEPIIYGNGMKFKDF